MKKIVFLLLPVFVLLSAAVQAQCSICTRTAQQLGEEPAKGLNAGIIYLAFAPLAIIGFLAYTWWKRERMQ